MVVEEFLVRFAEPRPVAAQSLEFSQGYDNGDRLASAGQFDSFTRFSLVDDSGKAGSSVRDGVSSRHERNVHHDVHVVNAPESLPKSTIS
jgi:hypothetical protein